ncbi:hypothetical protein MUGA111182_06985 [Mucilaginibacter galii]|uniref:Uncharacterized protein n=1 Tax=Mucilaginibacter galii TaxID=2005073 RepID=A0A917JBN0_9SPHI|nr:hypothetical protein [Mucilaginibacter galii]GGI51602.1 hypothetical protein GCM10011425_28140 [Mucilaginibacter galii]
METPNDGSKQPIKKTVMSNLKSGRLQILTAYFKESASTLLSLIPSRGKNDFDDIMRRVDFLHRATGIDKQYYVALTDAFKGKGFTDANNVAKTVCELRQRLRLPRFAAKTALKQSVEDLNLVFFVMKKMEKNLAGKGEPKFKPEFPLLVV